MEATPTHMKKFKEAWKDIKGFEQMYQISNLGRVKSFVFGTNRNFYNSDAKEMILSPNGQRKNYLHIGLHKNKRKFMTFKPKDGYEKLIARHLNDDRRNDHVDNLAWGTAQDNSNDCNRNGKRLVGNNVPQRKLNESDIPVIRNLLEGGMSLSKIGEKFKVSKKLILDIKQEKIWKCVKYNN